MKQNFAAILLLLALMMGAGCESTPSKSDQEKDGKKYSGVTFEIHTPPHVTVVPDQGEGYAVHYVRIDTSKSMMGIYEGLHPKLFSKKETDLTPMKRGHPTVRDNLDRGDDVWGVDSNGKGWRESVWECKRTFQGKNGNPFQVPTMIHIWYFGASEQEQVVFDTIIDGLTMKP